MAKKVVAKPIKKKSLLEALTGTKNTLEALTNCATNDIWDDPDRSLVAKAKVSALGNTDIEGVRWDEIEQRVLHSDGATIVVNSSGTVSRGDNEYINLDEAVSFEEEPHSRNMNKIKDYMFKTPGGSTKPYVEDTPISTVELKTQTRPYSPPKEEMSIKKEMKVEQIAYALFRDGVNLEGKYYVAIGPIFLNPVDKKEYRLSKVEGIDDLVSIEVPKYELMTTKKEKV